MTKYKVVYKGVELEIEDLPNGKFKIPDLGQFMRQGLGSMWLDEGRIPYVSDKDKESAAATKMRVGGYSENSLFSGYGIGDSEGEEYNKYMESKGRFPANLLVEDDILDDGKITVSRASDYNFEDSNNENSTHITHNIKSGRHFSDSGSFSRYFDLDAWYEKRIQELPGNAQKTFPFLIVPKASHREKNKGLEGNLKHREKDNPYQHNADKDDNMHEGFSNTHPTTKPIRLFSWLITIGSREGDVILDPYVGSGTTLIAAKILGRKAIGCDITQEYCEIAAARLDAEELVRQYNLLETADKATTS